MSEQHTFQAETQQLLDILIHSLYTEKEIFLRELISNASDALNRLQFEMLTNDDVADPQADLEIHIEFDEEAKTLTVSDTGIGMNRDEIIAGLGTIAKSGAKAFIEAMQEKPESASDIIGQFGVGFYSAFMVAKQVDVISRSYRPADEAVKWSATGGTNYALGDGGQGCARHRSRHPLKGRRGRIHAEFPHQGYCAAAFGLCGFSDLCGRR